MAARLVFPAGALQNLIRDRRNHRHLSHLCAALHSCELRLDVGLHGLSHHHFDLGFALALFRRQLALLQVVHQLLLDLLAHRLRVCLPFRLANGLHHFFLARQVHQVDKERHHHLLHVRRRSLDGFRQRVELLGTEAA